MSEPPAPAISPGNGMTFFPSVPLCSSQGQTDQEKTMWEGSRETLETAGSRARNNKRMHDASVGKIHAR